jgi:hypothetical protein
MCVLKPLEGHHYSRSPTKFRNRTMATSQIQLKYKATNKTEGGGGGKKKKKKFPLLFTDGTTELGTSETTIERQR